MNALLIDFSAGVAAGTSWTITLVVVVISPRTHRPDVDDRVGAVYSLLSSY